MVYLNGIGEGQQNLCLQHLFLMATSQARRRVCGTPCSDVSNRRHRTEYPMAFSFFVMGFTIVRR